MIRWRSGQDTRARPSIENLNGFPKEFGHQLNDIHMISQSPHNGYLVIYNFQESLTARNVGTQKTHPLSSKSTFPWDCSNISLINHPEVKISKTIQNSRKVQNDKQKIPENWFSKKILPSKVQHSHGHSEWTSERKESKTSFQ